ncbi:helix-turn-helix domain-containing protein [Herbaspirillum sp. YR522]|uniref:helix-turn-helix domain-containing protein n=1 Tax=Herbaspirillum sp. YR522 TaxID=1144342 RepID=UPI00026F5312|nr:helix-turn-helix domain-containing protein [Herbaspirillum sp. YR522]EJN10328.1 Helix-turn-helix protein [Herbaspirillum sp. YR522]
MPKKLMHDEARYPSLVAQRVALWGQYIHAARLEQRITAADLSQRARVSESTLRRLEQGDPGAAVGAYMAVLNVLGGLADLAPVPVRQVAAPVRRDGTVASRVRRSAAEIDDEYF